MQIAAVLVNFPQIAAAQESNLVAAGMPRAARAEYGSQQGGHCQESEPVCCCVEKSATSVHHVSNCMSHDGTNQGACSFAAGRVSTARQNYATIWVILVIELDAC